jgi:RecJ-like exonuclease
MSWTFETLQANFKRILFKHGQNAYLRRRCVSCSQTGPYAHYDDNCPVCGGTGYSQTLELYTMRKMIVGTQTGFVTSEVFSKTGPKLDQGTYFFCEGSVNPKFGDLIYDQNAGTGKMECYEINDALDRRYDYRVLFWNCACQIRPDLTP